MSNILRELCEAAQAAPDRRARLECGCMARPTMLIPCPWHRREFQEALRAVTEDEVECDAGCCDPA